MQKRVTVLNRQKAKKETPSSDICLISIWSQCALATKNYSRDDIKKDGWRDFLRLDFDDVDSIISSDGFVAFDDNMANVIISFIQKNNGANFIVHCDAGISRSVAVAKFMEDFFEYVPIYNGETTNADWKNTLVYAKLKYVLTNAPNLGKMVAELFGVDIHIYNGDWFSMDDKTKRTFIGDIVDVCREK